MNGFGSELLRIVGRSVGRIAGGIAGGISLLAGLCCTGSALAQAYPSKPVRIVVAFPPGGAADVLVRTLAPKLGEQLGQPVLVENRPGASGTIGVAYVAKAAPDGYTLICGSTPTISVAPHVYHSLPYQPLKDLIPISRLAMIPSLLVTHPSVPVANVRELIALLKAQPGKFAYGSAGAGSTQHLSGEQFKLMTGVELVHIPYKGGAPMMADLIGGQIALSFEPVNTATSQVRSGKIKALAVTTASRLASQPELATVAETLPGFELAIWFGLMAPTGTPREINARLESETIRALRNPEIRDRMTAQGGEIIADTSEEFAATLRKEFVTWADFAKRTGMKLD